MTMKRSGEVGMWLEGEDREADCGTVCLWLTFIILGWSTWITFWSKWYFAQSCSHCPWFKWNNILNLSVYLTLQFRQLFGQLCLCGLWELMVQTALNLLLQTLLILHLQETGIRFTWCVNPILGEKLYISPLLTFGSGNSAVQWRHSCQRNTWIWNIFQSRFSKIEWKQGELLIRQFYNIYFRADKQTLHCTLLLLLFV